MNLVEIRVIKVDTPLWIEEFRAFCVEVLGDLEKWNWSISIVLCDDDFIRGLNAEYRHKDVPTDVLSFPQDDITPAATHLTAGDVVISLDYMRKNAEDFESTECDEMKRLIVHGILHLNDMDHRENATSGKMLKLQERILQKHAGEFIF